MAHVLVTGGLGFIGSHLCERLLREGATVWCVDEGLGPDPAARRFLLQQFPRFRWMQADVVTLPALPCTPDLVVHLAAHAGVRAALADPCGYARTNVEGTVNVLEACRAAGVSKVLFASSSSVYGHPGQPGRASCEDDVLPPPLSPYAATKRAGELLCQTYVHLYAMDITALRFFSVYGPRQRPDLVLPTFVRQMLTGEPLRVYGDGTAVRDYTYIDDVVAGICAAMAKMLKVPRPFSPSISHGRYECYNLGSGAPVSLNTLMTTLQDALDLGDVGREMLPPHRADAACTWADIGQARRVLGYAPQVSFTEGVRRYVGWLRGESPLP
ncbi:MAG TPA: NAD-dependent epimerase/dehydratase family protein [Candidatus Tectomicrobia bacterium]